MDYATGRVRVRGQAPHLRKAPAAFDRRGAMSAINSEPHGIGGSDKRGEQPLLKRNVSSVRKVPYPCGA